MSPVRTKPSTSASTWQRLSWGMRWRWSLPRHVHQIEVRELGELGEPVHDQARAQERDVERFTVVRNQHRGLAHAGREPLEHGGLVAQAAQKILLEDECRGLALEPRDTDEKRDRPRPPRQPRRLGIDVKGRERNDLRQRRVEREQREHPARSRSSRLNTGATDPVSHREAFGAARKEAARSLDESEGEFTRYGRRHQAIRWRCLRQNTGDAHAKSLRRLTRIARELGERCVRRDIIAARFRQQSRFVGRRSWFARIGESNSVDFNISDDMSHQGSRKSRWHASRTRACIAQQSGSFWTHCHKGLEARAMEVDSNRLGRTPAQKTGRPLHEHRSTPRLPAGA